MFLKVDNLRNYGVYCPNVWDNITFFFNKHSFFFFCILIISQFDEFLFNFFLFLRLLSFPFYPSKTVVQAVESLHFLKLFQTEIVFKFYYFLSSCGPSIFSRGLYQLIRLGDVNFSVCSKQSDAYGKVAEFVVQCYPSR